MIIVFLFIAGCLVGSFLNVLIDRIPQEEQFLYGRSYCDSCRRKLKWFDLIPLLSFIILRGRCRYCRRKISRQYPVVEITTGILFPVIYVSGYSCWPYLVSIFSGLLVIFVTDLKYHIIPDQILIFLIILSLIFFLFSPLPFINNFISGLTMFLLFLILTVVTKGKGMGFGDVKYSFFMGLFLGFPNIVVAFYFSFLTGALVSLILILIGKKTMKSTIPFGPFLVAATVVSYLYGTFIWNFAKGVTGI